jgi:hypothetical protein
MKDKFLGAFGAKDGEADFYDILSRYGAKEIQDFQRIPVEKARLAVKDLYETLEAQLAGAAH